MYQRYDLDPAAIPALLDVAGESSSGRAMRFSFAKFCTLLHTAARFRALPPPLPPGRGNVIIVAGDSVSRDMALAWRCSAAAGKGRALVEFPAFAMLAYRALEGKLMGEALECAPANVEQCFFSIDNAHAGPIRCCNTLKEALDAAEMKGLRREDVGAVLAGYGAHYHVGADANASETMMRSHMQGIFRTLDEYCQVSYNSRLILSSLCCVTISLLLTLPRVGDTRRFVKYRAGDCVWQQCVSPPRNIFKRMWATSSQVLRRPFAQRTTCSGHAGASASSA